LAQPRNPTRPTIDEENGRLACVHAAFANFYPVSSESVDRTTELSPAPSPSVGK
jgi:hypothetical protein